MTVAEEMIYKKELQTSEACSILDMSQQNLYKMRKEGRMPRLIESQDSKFYKESVYQEWFQRHIKAFNTQLSLTPMETLMQLLCDSADGDERQPFRHERMMPVVDVLLSNYGSAQSPVKIPMEYTMRFYNIIATYAMELILNFEVSQKQNSRIESEINAFIQSLAQQTAFQDEFRGYIELLKTHCFKQGANQSPIKSFIQVTDVYEETMVFDQYLDSYLSHYDSFRETMIVTLLNLIKSTWTSIMVYQKSDDLRLRMTFFNGFSTTKSQFQTFVRQLLALIYDTRGVVSI